MRGAMREIATLAAVAIAGAIAWGLTPPILSAIGKQGSFFGMVGVTGVLLAIAFVAIYAGFHFLMNRVRLEGRAALADRIGGGVFGFIRAFALIGLGFLGYSYYLDADNRPDTVSKAALLPLASGAASFFERFGDPVADLKPQDGDEAQVDAAAQGYSRGARENLSELVTTVTTTDSSTKSVKPDRDLIADILSEERQGS